MSTTNYNSIHEALNLLQEQAVTAARFITHKVSGHASPVAADKGIPRSMTTISKIQAVRKVLEPYAQTDCSTITMSAECFAIDCSTGETITLVVTLNKGAISVIGL